MLLTTATMANERPEDPNLLKTKTNYPNAYAANHSDDGEKTWRSKPVENENQIS